MLKKDVWLLQTRTFTKKLYNAEQLQESQSTDCTKHSEEIKPCQESELFFSSCQSYTFK